MGSRGAVIVGVDRTGGGLPMLRGAAADAEKVEEWLSSEGFETVLLTDTKAGVRGGGRVMRTDIDDTVNHFVERGVLQQLVIYFAGHGLNNFNTEIWLLSGAPSASNEAINLARNIELARDCGIRNVVFVSDACRSNPPPGPFRRVEGGAIFPNLRGPPGPRGRVDRLLPTAPNAAAFEVDEPIDEIVQRSGIFTKELLAAHGFPASQTPQIASLESLVRVDDSVGAGVRVIDLARLGAHLEERVPVAAAERLIAWPQQPECIVETPPLEKHLGRALFPDPQIDADSNLPLETNRAGGRRGGSTLGFSEDSPANNLRATLQLRLGQSTAIIKRADRSENLNFRTGVQLTGERAVWVGSSGLTAERLEEHPDFHRIYLRADQSAGTVAIELAGGTGAIIAAFEGYIASLKIVGGRVTNVSYIPSHLDGRWLNEPEQWQQLAGLRAAVSAQVKHGVFRLSGEDPMSFADRIRTLKAIDPTLGIYAAYAYQQAGELEGIHSVAKYMREDLRGFLPFDVALLGSAPGTGAPFHDPIAPFCPMLMQGWPLLRNRFETLPGNLERLQKYLVPALWTTIDPDGMKIIRNEILPGGLNG
jgi:hypothetical protein